MEDRGLISVIVPVYNVEKYLSACVCSVLKQTYPCFEVILVDDGSTDGSGALCDLWKKQDSRIQVIHQENGGLSAARNTGMQIARGEYLCFVDSDDLVAPDYLRILYENLIAFHADVSCCHYASFSDDQPDAGLGSKLAADFDGGLVTGFDGELDSGEGNLEMRNCPRLCSQWDLWETLTSTGADCCSTWLVVAWNKLIRKEVLEDLSFPLGKWHEDEFFIHRLLSRSHCLVETTAELYFYRQRAEGISGGNNWSDIRHLDLVDALEERVRTLLDGNLPERDQDSIESENSTDRKFLYRKMVSAYRQTIVIQYHTFGRGREAVMLKLRFLKSFVQFPVIERRFWKSYLLFCINAGWYYRKYWD